MVALVIPDEDERYLLAILDSPDGLDLAEFAWYDPQSDDGCYRAWDYQWVWYTSNEMFQVEQGARSTGKTVGIRMRSCAFPFYFEGQSMLLTAPELNHLRPLTDEIEKSLLGTRLFRMMLPDTKSKGLARQPHWQVRFKNGAALISRLPNKDGKGVKGCVAEGSLILTARGQIPIESVVVGDEVLTHLGRWKKVQATYKCGAAPAVTVRGAGHPGLAMSETHSMLARRNKNPQRKRSLESPVWLTPACEVAEGEPGRWYLGSPTVFPENYLPPPTDEFAWVAGAYVADGSLRYNGDRPRGISITDDADSIGEVTERLDLLDVAWKIYDKPSRAVRLDIESTDYAAWLERECGRGAAGKKIPDWLLGSPRRVRRAFLDGYLHGDGHRDEVRGRWVCSSASKALIVGLRLLAQSLGKVASMSFIDPQVTEIAGVKLKKPPQRSWRLIIQDSGRNAVVEDGISWQKVHDMELGREANVYDLTVEDDHSYIADGLISHNQHVINIELDEAQDYPANGWVEIVECLNAGQKGAMWRCHGVSKGIRDRFFEKTQPHSGWKVHRPMAMQRPTWGPKERESKIRDYGGSRQSVDYKRNIYGEHGDAANSVFVLARLMDAVDLDDGSTYNQDVYTHISLTFEDVADADPEDRSALLMSKIDIPGIHKVGYSQKFRNKEVGSPKGYSAFWAGMDIGVTNHPSELLVFGQRTGTDFVELLLRIHMARIDTDDQKAVIGKVFEFYGDRLRMGIDKTGVGFPIWDQLTRTVFGTRIFGFGFAEKRVVAIEDRPLQGSETIKDLARLRNVVEASTDWLRNDYVDAKRIRLPNDSEVLGEFQGQTYTTVKDTGDPYGNNRKLYAGGSFHTLDAAKMMVAAKHIPPLEAMLEERPQQEAVLDQFLIM